MEWNYTTKVKEQVATCDLCGASNFRVISCVDRYRLAARFNVCQSCTFCFVSPRMTQEEYDKFYRDGVYRYLVAKHTAHDPTKVEELENAQRIFSAWLKTNFAECVEPYRGGRLLDVGGSGGIIAADFRESFGLQATVVEPSEDERSRAIERGLTVHAGNIESYESTEPFDVVCFVQTIDHVLSPRNVLRKLRRLTKGLLIVDCINFAPMFRAHKHLACKIDHPSNLNNHVMLAYLRRTGFRVDKQVWQRNKHAIAYACTPDVPDETAMPSPSAVHMIKTQYLC